jgi:DDE superfamily endonuclease
MEDVLEVYQRPYDPERPQVCLDEARKELHSTPRGVLTCQPAQPVRQDYEYERHGTASLFAWVEPLTGRRKVRVTTRQTGWDFAEQLRLLVDEDYPEAVQIVLVVDNLQTHSPACLYARFPPAEARRIARKLEWHYTPEHGSWLNVAECELSVLARQCLSRRLPDIDTLTREVAAWEQQRNQAHLSIDWRFTTADARIKLKRLYPVLKEQTEQKAA